jgi:hypothetical protein
VKIILILLFSFIHIYYLSKPVFADTVSDTNYSVDVGNIDTNPQPTPKSQVLDVTNISQPKEFTTGSNYTVSTSNDSFSMQLSQDSIDFGILSSTNPVIRTSGITLTNGLHGGEIFSYENHPLTSSTNDVIENTTCDNGSCSSEIAAPWSNTLTYGFGYRCDSTNTKVCDPQFSQSNYFKQYPNDADSQPPEAVIANSNGQAKTTITYKVNISGTQKTGGYYNSITYLAIPNF